MTHYRMQDDLPSAIITVNGSETKIYNGNTIFLNNGENFEFRFFNPLQEKIGVGITMNGISKGDGLLILNPGQDISLDRFINENSKMIFETYHIDGNNSKAVQAAELNGLIEFNFYREKQKIQYRGGGLPHFGKTFTSPGTYCCDYDQSFIGGSGTLSSSRSFTTSNNCQPLKSCKTTKPVETGRIEKGDESNQNLVNVDVDFETYAFHTINYSLKPFSAKPTQITEIRNYCPGCSYRIRKSSWKYCPKCAESLQ